ncbi:MAG: hypothetical protein GY774_11590 [Planctomycetes bacterium]|nr:hypothetical protein [Planctomycetota bacterium]
MVQILILARGKGTEGWMDILVLVVVAVVYGLGALIRAKGKKNQDQAQEQPRKPQQKPATGGRGMLEKFIIDVQKAAEQAKSAKESSQPSQRAHQQTAHPQTAARKYAAGTKQARHTPPISTPAKLKLSKTTPQVQSDPNFKRKAVAGLPGKRKSMPAETDEYKYLTDVLSDYEDPEDLKRAILHYEILGRPLALRDSSRDIIGL